MNWIGAFLVVLAAYYFGVILADGEKKRLDELEMLIALIGYMRRRMSVERMKLFCIFSSFREQRDCAFTEILTTSNCDIPTCWMDAVEGLSIDIETKNELFLLGESLGRVPLDEQIKRLDSCEAALIKCRDREKDELPNRQKSKKTFCLIVGLMIAIILL